VGHLILEHYPRGKRREMQSIHFRTSGRGGKKLWMVVLLELGGGSAGPEGEGKGEKGGDAFKLASGLHAGAQGGGGKVGLRSRLSCPASHLLVILLGWPSGEENMSRKKKKKGFALSAS